MKKLHIDIETYSPADLQSAGLYNYVAHPEFEVLLLAYSIDNSPVILVDLARGGRLPEEFMDAYRDPNCELIAHNAAFERTCLNKMLGPTDVTRWTCTMAMCAYAGIELSLSKAAWMLGVDNQKMQEGKPCIAYFCSPCKPTKANEGRTRNLPEHNLGLWLAFCDYCAQDVRTEIDIYHVLAAFELPNREKQIYAIDQTINDAGVLVDVNFAERAAEINGENAQELTREVTALGVVNPNSVQQMREFCATHGVEIDNLRAATVEILLKDKNLPVQVRTALQARQGLRKASVKKYTAITERVSEDGRVRGMFQYYGAARTGRWAGRAVQVHNLPRNYLTSIDTARSIVASNLPATAAAEAISVCYAEEITDILSQLIRTAFVAPAGRLLLVSDFSAIEARVLAWLASEKWRLDVFSGDGKIYETSASRMFGVPLEQVTKGSRWRQLGKVAELALGYQGGVGALRVMGAEQLGLSAAELKDIVTKWRAASPAIAKFWRDCEDAAKGAIEAESEVFRVQNENVTLQFVCSDGWLRIHLPSGRSLNYYRPRLLNSPNGIPDIIELYAKMRQSRILTLEAASKALTDPPATAPAWLNQATTNRYNFRSLLRLFSEMEETKKMFGHYAPIITFQECGGGAVHPQHVITSTYGGKLTENITQAVARDCLAEAMILLHYTGNRIAMHVHDEVVIEADAHIAEEQLKQVEETMARPISWAPNLPLCAEGFLSVFYKK